ncbi:MAG: hypothetical protein ACRELZ_13555 [Candidatus Rokuibacteriota bacterium]
MSLKRLAVALGASALVAFAVAQAQDATVQKLVGRWEGKVDVRDEPGRTLIIRSVILERDQWMANIEYGQPGASLSVLEARIERQGAKTIVSFGLSTTRKVELQLISERELRGLLKISDNDGSWVGRKMSLQKTSDKP